MKIYSVFSRVYFVDDMTFPTEENELGYTPNTNGENTYVWTEHFANLKDAVKYANTTKDEVLKDVENYCDEPIDFEVNDIYNSEQGFKTREYSMRTEYNVDKVLEMTIIEGEF